MRWAPPRDAAEAARRAIRAEYGRRARERRRARPPQPPCAKCGALIASPRRRKYCGDRRACQLRRRASWPTTCRSCGDPVEPGRRGPARIYCSTNCRHRGRRRSAVTRRTRLRILERDGWHCYLCDRPIDRARAGTDPLAASVDHVWPTAMGGPDDENNLRAAHLGCNLEKGDGPPPWWLARAAAGTIALDTWTRKVA